MTHPIAITLKNVHKRMGAENVLRGISLQIKRGEVLALIGASGSGKSTLLRCCNLLEIPDEGEIEAFGEPISLRRRSDHTRFCDASAQVDRLRRQVGMVFQNFALWSHMTVLENLTLAPRRVLGHDTTKAEHKARYWLERMGIADKAAAYSSELSGGQQQRAAIARALCMDPKVLLMDEPTSALDPESTESVLAAIRTMAREGHTLVLVTHELSFVKEAAHRVVFLHNGAIEEDGVPSEVLVRPKSARCRAFVCKEYRASVH
jgi:ABC-type histidine transport system ATPase subunit